jgi:hypothetical protein
MLSNFNCCRGILLRMNLFWLKLVSSRTVLFPTVSKLAGRNIDLAKDDLIREFLSLIWYGFVFGAIWVLEF